MAGSRLTLLLLAVGLFALMLLPTPAAASGPGSSDSSDSSDTDSDEAPRRRCCGKGEILPMRRPCRQHCCKVWRPVCVAGHHTPMTTVANTCEASRLACQRNEKLLYVVCYDACPWDSNKRPLHYHEDEPEHHNRYPDCGCGCNQ